MPVNVGYHLFANIFETLDKFRFVFHNDVDLLGQFDGPSMSTFSEDVWLV